MTVTVTDAADDVAPIIRSNDYLAMIIFLKKTRICRGTAGRVKDDRKGQPLNLDPSCVRGKSSIPNLKLANRSIEPGCEHSLSAPNASGKAVGGCITSEKRPSFRGAWSAPPLLPMAELCSNIIVCSANCRLKQHGDMQGRGGDSWAQPRCKQDGGGWWRGWRGRRCRAYGTQHHKGLLSARFLSL